VIDNRGWNRDGWIGKADDEIHWRFVNGRAAGSVGILYIEGACGECDDFVWLACCASLERTRDPCSHVWPPVVPLGLGDGFVTVPRASYESLVYLPLMIAHLKASGWGR